MKYNFEFIIFVNTIIYLFNLMHFSGFEPNTYDDTSVTEAHKAITARSIIIDTDGKPALCSKS